MQNEKDQKAQRSIITKYRREIWKPFIVAVNRYALIQEGDNIAVCLSGGKDSMLMAKCMQELQEHGKYPFGLQFVVMDPGYNEMNRQVIIDNAQRLQIPINLFKTDIFDVVASVNGSPCYLCARMRRGYLYQYAQALGCNKIALGHHFDDVVETILMSMFYGAEFKTMMPKLHSTNWQGMQLIRPLYMVKEEDILAWKRYNDLQFIQCACRFTENCAAGDSGEGSKRQEMKRLIKQLKQFNPNADKNIFNTVHNVSLDTIIGYRTKNSKYNFLDDYDG